MIFLSMLRRPPIYTLFPYTTLFRSRRAGRLAGYEPRRVHRRDRRIAARPGDRAPGERVAARVLRGRGELHGLIHLARRRGRRDVDRGDRWRRRRWWRRRWRRRRRHRDGRGAVFPFARRGDRRRAGRLAGYEPRRVHRRGRRIAARPGDRAPGERVAARVLRGRGELHGLSHLDRRRGRRDVDRGDRWGRWRRWWRWGRW